MNEALLSTESPISYNLQNNILPSTNFGEINDEEKYLLVKNIPSQIRQVKEDFYYNETGILDENTEKTKNTLKKLWLASIVCLLFMIIEIIGGYLAHSLAIMSDAAHLLSDLLGFIISIVSIYISRRKASDKMSFGYHRAEVIGALVSVYLVWGLTIWLIIEAKERLINKPKVDGFIMLVTAVIGFVFNVIMGLILMNQGIGINY